MINAAATKPAVSVAGEPVMNQSAGGRRAAADSEAAETRRVSPATRANTTREIRTGQTDIAEKAPQDIVSYFKNEGAGWVNHNDPDDDVTFVVIKVK